MTKSNDDFAHANYANPPSAASPSRNLQYLDPTCLVHEVWRQSCGDLCLHRDCAIPIDAFRPLSFHLQLALAGPDHLLALGTMSLL